MNTLHKQENYEEIESFRKEISGVRTIEADNGQEFTFCSVYEEDKEEQRIAREAELEAEREPLILEIRSLLRSSLSNT